MIFVTVGTHEQPFNRLVEAIDVLKRNLLLKEEVFIQIGYSTYEPKYCQWKNFLPYQDMEKKLVQARVVITHGGPASFIQTFQAGKIPIVVPRQSKYGEHVNDHQVEFTKAVEERMGMIIPVYEMNKLGEVISHYDELAASRNCGECSHNQEFNRMFGKLVDELL